jgi:hypothetical protein
LPLKKKLRAALLASCQVIGILGASATSASAVSVSVTTGLNSPEGTNTVEIPSAATPGALNAIGQIATSGPGSNLCIWVTP